MLILNELVGFGAADNGGGPFLSLNAALGATVTLNPSDKSANITLSGGNLVAASNGSATHNLVRATQGLTSQKAYWEVTLAGVGAGTVNYCGAIDGAAAVNGVAFGSGTLSFAFGYDSANGLYVGAGHSTTGTASALTNTTFGIAYDGSSGKVFLRDGSGWKNSGNPNAGTGYVWLRTGSLIALFPGLSFDVSAAGKTYTFNFGASAFAYGVP